MIKYSCILFIAIVLGFFSCKKEKKKEPEPSNSVMLDIYPSDSLKQYIFKPGTYWIYKKTTSSDVDTVKVSSIREFNCTQGPCSVHGLKVDTCRTYHWTIMELKSSFFANHRVLSFCKNTISTGVGTWCENYPIHLLNQNGGDSIGSPYIYVHYNYATITVLSNTFSHVTKVKATNSTYNALGSVFNAPTGYNNVSFFLAKNIGIIRKEILVGPSQTDVWDLVAWNIVQ